MKAEPGEPTAVEVSGLGWRWLCRGPIGARHHGSALHASERLALDDGQVWLREQGR